MSSYGRRQVAQVGMSVDVSADGRPESKQGGITLDWQTVDAATQAATLSDGVQIAVGDLYLRYGQVLTKITNPATAVVTINGSPTGGTFTVSVTTYTTANDANGNPVTTANTQTTAGVAYNASAATLQTAIRGLSNVGGTLATVTGSAGGPYTITFDASLGQVAVASDGTSLTGGSSPTATTATSAFGGDVGKYGPYDPSALDGRQTLTIGSCFVLRKTIKFNDLYSDHPEVLYGGLVFKDRIIQSGTATHTLAAGPTFAELIAALPRLAFVTESPS